MTSTLGLVSKFKINPFFWFVLGIGVVTGYFREVIMVFMIVFIHEMGHVLSAHFFKWRIHKVELLPFGGVAEVEDAGNKPFIEELIVILAGPLQHLWLIGLSFFCLQFSFWSTADHQLFLTHNLIILCFNLLPILPLDGGRLIQLLCAYAFPYMRAMQIARRVSFAFLTGATILGAYLFPFHLNLWVVFSFLLIVNYLEWKQRHFKNMRFLMNRHTTSYQNRTDLISTQVSIRDSVTVQKAVKHCRRGHQHSFKVYDIDQGVSYVVPERTVLTLYFEKRMPKAPLATFDLRTIGR